MKASLWLIFIFSLMTAGCGQQQKLPLSSPTAQSSNSPTLSEQDKAQLWNAVPKEGIVSEGPLKGTQGYAINPKEKFVSFDIPIFKGDNAAKKAISNLPGATIEVFDGAAGKTARVNIPLYYFSTQTIQTQGNVSIIDPTKLPNGDELPGIPGGELPKLAVGYPVNENVTLYIYLASKYIGVFAETPKVNPYVKTTFPLKDLTQSKIVGYLSTVPAKSGYNGGFWLSMVVPGELSRLIEDLIN